MSASWFCSRPNSSIIGSGHAAARGIARRVAVVARRSRPCPRLLFDFLGERVNRLLPALATGRAPVLFTQLAREQRGIGIDLPPAVLAPEQVTVRFRVLQRERIELEAELLGVRKRQQMRARDPHRAGFAVEARRERLAQREDAAANAVLRFEDQRIVTGAQELRARGLTGDPRPHDDDALARPGVGGRPS